MLGFLGAILSAPLSAAGAISKGTGEALEIGAGDMPIARAAGTALQGAGELLSAGASSINDSISGASFTLGGMGVDMAALGRGISSFTSSLTPGSQEVSQSLARAPEISAPSVAAVVDKFTVGAEELGSFTPTPIGGSNGGRGMGIG